MHYTRLRSVENAREAYRAVARGALNIDAILAHSASYRLEELPEVFSREAESLEAQESIKTLILP